MAKHDFWTNAQSHPEYTDDEPSKYDKAIDIFRLSQGYHNGPQCRRCGEMKCQHCHPEFIDEECPLTKG